MNCLVIGGSGFIGTYLIEKLIKNGNNVVNFDLVSSRIENLQTIKGDIRNRSDLDKINFDIDCIYVLAAIHRDDIQDINEYYKTNFDGLNNIIDFCNSINISEIIYYSSAAVYGDSFIDAKETDELSPDSHYGKSKVKAENSLVKWVKQKDKRKLLIVRPSVVYGLGSNSNMNRLINYVINNRFFIIGKGGNVKSISYVKNLVDFTCYVKSKMNSQITVYNYSDFPQMTIREVCDKISYTAKCRKVISVPYLFGYIFACFMDIISFILNKKLPISLVRINKSRTYTSLSTKKIEGLKYESRFNFNNAISEMIKYQ